MKLTSQHYAAIGLMLVSLSAMGSAAHDWSEVMKPQFLFGVLGVIGSSILNMMAPAPERSGLGDTKADLTKIGKLSLVLLLVGSVAVVGCAGKADVNPVQVAVSVETQTHETLKTVQGRVVAFCADNQTFQSTCREIGSALEEAWDAQIEFNRSIAEMRVTRALSLITELQELGAKVGALPASAKDALMRDIGWLVDLLKGVR